MYKCLIVTALIFIATNVNATIINFGPKSASGSGPTITFSNLVSPTSIIGDAIITLNINGDFNHNIEYADILLDNYSLGRILDNNTSNDAFNFTGDVGNESRSTLTATATISESIFSTLISDGLLNLSIDTSPRVDCCGTVNHLSGTISFTEGVKVPEPAGLALLGLGLLGIRFTRKPLAKKTLAKKR